MVLVTMMPTGTTGNQEYQVVFGGSNHATLLLTAKLTMNMALAVVQLIRYEKGLRGHRTELYKRLTLPGAE